MNCKNLLLLLLPTMAVAQERAVTLSGSVQSDMMVAPQQDSRIGTSEYDNDAFLTNTYVDLMMQSRWVDAGGRLEYNQHPMPGFQNANNDFKGWGVPNLWVKGKLGKVEVTLGSFYEQFGTGFILRSYEERSLGIDNSLTGLHIVANPFRGVSLKLLRGIQRDYWAWNVGKVFEAIGKTADDPRAYPFLTYFDFDRSKISGADLELSLDEWISALQDKGMHLTVGGSWVNKSNDHNDEQIAADLTHVLNVPEYVNALDVRARFQMKGLSLQGEYAQKSQDPNSLNSYIYGKGHAEMFSATYVKRGFTSLVQVKRSENMGFRSQRSMSPLSSACYINHQPAFTLDHTYALAALYPYATQMEGEWAYQASVGYKMKGRYAPKFKVNYSLVNGLENALQNRSNPAMRGTDGAESDFWKQGETYYQDLNVEFEKKINKSFDLHLMYMYQQYNKTVIQNEGGNIYSNIFVADGKYKFNKRYTLRCEGQFLYTEHESGNWGFVLAELSVAPYLMFTVSDQIGKCEPESGVYGETTHYFQGLVTGNFGAHRLQAGYGRTRSGYNCNGGVCRYIPASKGFTISYNYNF